MRRIVFADLETGGLDPAIHSPWEFAFIVRRLQPDLGVGGGYGGRLDTEYLWRTVPDWEGSDPEAMRINRCRERTAGMDPQIAREPCNLAQSGMRMWSRPEHVAAEIARLLDGAVVIGSNPGFDVDFLKPFLSLHGQTYKAHYRPLCITAIAWGYLNGRGRANGLRWPLSSDEISRALGIDPDDYDRHTALGDCAWVRDQWDVIV